MHFEMLRKGAFQPPLPKKEQQSRRGVEIDAHQMPMGGEKSCKKPEPASARDAEGVAVRSTDTLPFYYLYPVATPIAAAGTVLYQE